MLIASMPKDEMRRAIAIESSGCPRVSEAGRSKGQMRSMASVLASAFMRSRVEGSCPSLPFLGLAGPLALPVRRPTAMPP